MHIQKVSHTSGHKKFSVGSLSCTNQSESTEDICMLSGVSKDGTFGWLTSGSVLEVFSLSNGQRLSAWNFGAVIKEPSTVITAISECYFVKSPMLVIATSTVNPEGLVCFFDPKNFRIIKAIEIPYAVKSLEVVNCNEQRQTNNILVSDQVKHFCGVLAVGTHCGHVYLIDMCLDDDTEGCDELTPNSLQYLDHNVKDIVGFRYAAISHSKHLCLELGAEYHVRGYFNYCKCDGTNLKSFSADDIDISCLKFVEKTGLLVIGYSFGAFQLWLLRGLVHEYSSRYEDGLPPVNSVAYQEPENDPRNYCYLWVARGPQPSDPVEAYTSGITLYQLGYNRKSWYPGYGHLFEDLKDVGPRFEHDLTLDPFNMTLGGHGEGSRVISCFTIEDSGYRASNKKCSVNDSCEDCSGADLSLCVFVWEAASLDPDVRRPCYLGIFDMNRWYHAHMPATLRLYGGTSDICPYFAICSLAGVQQEADMENIMAVHISQRNLSRFQSVLFPEPEQHFFPSSLTFDVTCITEGGVVHATYLGLQQQILSDFQAHGPSALSEPHDLYKLCLHAGLLPRSVEAVSSSVPSMYKRDALLTMALNHNFIGFLNSCATALAAGELACDGWTLKSLLEWAWKRVASIKECVDRLCVPLYDWSGAPIDKQTMHLLQQHCTALKNLSCLLSNMTSQSLPVTEQGHLELETKRSVITLIVEHVDVVLWLCSVNILPECSEEQMHTGDCYVYPRRAFTDFYDKRRSELYRLHSGIKTSKVLLIDGLIEQIGEPLCNLWEKEGGTDQYPPPSVHAVVNMFLLENMSKTDKYIIVFYLLCDLLSSAPEEKQSEFHEKIISFTQKYDIPLGLTKLIQGMWLLDHKDFEDSMFYLLDPSVKKEVLAWQHRCILKALLYQGQPKLALQYLKVRSPPNKTPEDVKLKLTVLLSNGLTAEAFEFQRLSRDRNNVTDLLSHLFLGCQETKTVDQLLLLPFSENEEHHLVSHLQSSSELLSKELLVLYYLQRSRYVEAVRLNHRIKQQHLNELDPVLRERTRVRNCLVDGYHRLLPSVQRKLCLKPDQPAAANTESRMTCTRPKPLSTVVNKLNKKVLTRSALLETVLSKVHELKDSLINPEEAQSDASNYADEKTPGPFVCTPVISRTNAKTRVIPDVEFPHVDELTAANRTETFQGLVSELSSQTPESPLKSRIYGTSSPFANERTSHSYALKSCRRQHLFKTEALLLLNTPPVKRKKPSPSDTEITATVPHSILKVQHQQVVSQEQMPLGKPVFKMNELSGPTTPHKQNAADLDSVSTKLSAFSSSEKSVDRTSVTSILSHDHGDSISDTGRKTLQFADVPMDVSDEDSNTEGNTEIVLPELESRRNVNEIQIPEKTEEMKLRQSYTTEYVESKFTETSQSSEIPGKVHFEDSALKKCFDQPYRIEESTCHLTTLSAVQASSDETVDTEHMVTSASITNKAESNTNKISSEDEIDADVTNSKQAVPYLVMDVSTDFENPEDDGDNIVNDKHMEGIAEHTNNDSSAEAQNVIKYSAAPGNLVTPGGVNQITAIGNINEHEKLVQKDEYEEHEYEESMKEVKTPCKLTKFVKLTSVIKKTSIKVIDVDQSEDEDETPLSVDSDNTKDTKKLNDQSTEVTDKTICDAARTLGTYEEHSICEEQHSVDVTSFTDKPAVSTPRMRTRHSVTPRRSLRSRDDKASGTLTKTDLAQHNLGHTMTPKQGSRTPRQEKTQEKLVLTPVRKSSRLATSKESQQKLQQDPKTPRRQTRSSSHSTTPPKSNTSSPSSVSSVGSIQPTSNRRAKSVSKTKPESAKKKVATPRQRTSRRASKTPSRASSRASSPALSETGTEESFVMTLRSSHKLATPDTTPESVKSGLISGEDSEVQGYRFSIPLSLAEVIEENPELPTDENPKLSTPVQEFLFSPPLTRSRRRASASNDHVANADSEKDIAVSSTKKLKRSRVKGKKSSKSVSSVEMSTESPISFIPELSEEEIESDSSVASSRAHGRAENVRSLRPRRRDRKMLPLKW